MYQNVSGTKAWTRLYCSTTKPRVGNWHGPERGYNGGKEALDQSVWSPWCEEEKWGDEKEGLTVTDELLCKIGYSYL